MLGEVLRILNRSRDVFDKTVCKQHVHFYKEVNNELWKRLFCNDDCCPLLGCIQDIEDVEAIQGQAYTIKKDGSKWMQDVLNNKVA